jgi:uncharacterized protein YraI
MRTLPLIVLFTLLLSACSVSLSDVSTPTLTEEPFNTPTLPPTATVRPSETPTFTPTFAPTVIPVEGTVQTQLNVRTTADKNSPSLGMIKAGEKVQIIGKNETGEWWLILYPADPSGLGWVAAPFISTKSKPEVPVVSSDILLTQGTPIPSPTSIGGLSAVTLVKVNVRSGPGTAFNSLGMIDPEKSLTLTGKNEGGTWLQIFKVGGPGDRGWVSSAYVRVDGDTGQLPIFDEYGTPVVPTSGTPQADQPTPTLVPVMAADDGDSAQNPAANIVFSPEESRRFSYSSAVSAPEGDASDWVQFTPYSPQSVQTDPIFLSLDCEGNGSLNVELLQAGVPLPNWGSLTCDKDSGALALPGGSPYSLKLSAAPGVGGLQSVLYTLTVESGQ